MKTCNKCGEEKQATSEYFCKKKKHKDGLSYTCKDCDREYRKQRKAKNKKKKFIYDDKKVKACNKCKIEKPTTPDYFHKDIKLKDGLANTCKECANKKSQKYLQKNKETFAKYKRKHYQENREHYSEYMRNYYQDNKEQYSEYGRKHRQDNPELHRLHNQRRRARIAELPHDLTAEEWEEALGYFNNECAYCGDSESGLHQEHVIPVSKGGGYTADNIIPACQSCNFKKHTTDLEEWYVKYRHYDEERLNKILDYIEVMEEI